RRYRPGITGAARRSKTKSELENAVVAQAVAREESSVLIVIAVGEDAVKPDDLSVFMTDREIQALARLKALDAETLLGQEIPRLIVNLYGRAETAGGRRC